MSSNDSSLNNLRLRTIEQIFRNMSQNLEISFPINNVSHEIAQSIRNDPNIIANLMRRRERDNLQYILDELSNSGTNSITVRENELARLWEITDSDNESELETLDSHSDEINSEEIQDTKEDQLVPKCSVCLENNSIIMFISCGHLCSCNECSKRLNNCPICRMRINGKQRIYFS